jgi:hypothetical protein
MFASIFFPRLGALAKGGPVRRRRTNRKKKEGVPGNSFPGLFPGLTDSQQQGKASSQPVVAPPR